MVRYTDLDIPVEGYCSLEEAGMYLIFGSKPAPRWQIPQNLGNYYTPARNKKYIKAQTKVLNVLCELLKNGQVTAIHTPTSSRQKHMKSINPKTWQGVTATDIIHGKTSLTTAMVNFEQLQAVAPAKDFVVGVQDDGRFYVTDCKKVAIIAKTRPGYNKYEWVKFYFEHPNQAITKQDMIKQFEGSLNEFKKDDEMNEYVFKIFEDYIPVMHQCFPILDTDKIQFTPTFTSTDALVF